MDFRNYIPAENPRKIIGMVLAFSVILLVLWLFMVSRMSYQSLSPDIDPASMERRDSVREMMGKNNVDHSPEQQSTGVFLNAITTFVVLMIILCGVWFLVQRKTSFGHTNKTFRELGQHVIGPNLQLKILEINNEIWILGIGGNEISLLHRYPKDQWKKPIDTSDPSGQRFFDMFSGKS